LRLVAPALARPKPEIRIAFPRQSNIEELRRSFDIFDDVMRPPLAKFASEHR
jgi:hypothetical protein